MSQVGLCKQRLITFRIRSKVVSGKFRNGQSRCFLVRCKTRDYTLCSVWKWTYLVKKHREGELITRYIEASAAQAAVDLLLTLENEPVLVNTWIEQHMNPELVNRMKQTIRARRKRHFNAEHQHTRKKSIDLEFVVWQRLAGLAQRRGKTLSETIVQLIEDAEHKEKYASKMSSLKHDLQVLLGKE